MNNYKQYICQKPWVEAQIMPSGDVIIHGGFVDKAPMNDQSFESELHIFHEIKKTVPQKVNK